MIVPSKVYRAYIFPVHWADSSNFRAICSRARATSVCLRFRRIRNVQVAIFLKFINLLYWHGTAIELVGRDVKLISREATLTKHSLCVVAACCGARRDESRWFPARPRHGCSKSHRRHRRRRVILPITCVEDIEDSVRVGDTEGGALNHSGRR